MRNQKYSINIQTGEGLNDLIKALKAYQKNIKTKSKELLQRLTDEGYEIASSGFDKAQYDGTNDVKVAIEEREDHVRAIVASGNTALFIEFGTGVYYSDDHPEAAQHGMIRGAYGQGKGKNRTWGYYGDAGTNGVPKDKEKDGKRLILTHGNPANKPMYETVKRLEKRLPELVREVFGID